MQILDTESFKSKIFDFEANGDKWAFAGTRPAIVDFYADWCGPCRAQGPILEDLARDYAGQIDVYKINTDTTPQLAALFGVRGIPALLFIPMAGEPAMSSGLMQRESLDRAILDLFGVRAKGTLS